MIKKIIGWLFYIGGILGGAYVGVWMLFVKPILDVCQSFDTNTLTGTIIGAAVLKCLFAAPLGVAIIMVGCIIGTFIIAWSEEK